MTPDIVTCATCGLSWDDKLPTSMTPVPLARCPFEWFHSNLDTLDDEKLTIESIPEDWPVKPYTGDLVFLNIEWDRQSYNGSWSKPDEVLRVVHNHMEAYAGDPKFEMQVTLEMETNE